MVVMMMMMMMMMMTKTKIWDTKLKLRSLRSKHFQSSYCAKVRAKAKKMFLLFSQLSRRTREETLSTQARNYVAQKSAQIPIYRSEITNNLQLVTEIPPFHAAQFSTSYKERIKPGGIDLIGR